MKIGVLSDTHDQGELILKAVKHFNDEKVSWVFHGHTPQQVNHYHGKTLSLNPGPLMRETSKDLKGASIAIYDTEAHKARHVVI